MVWSSVHVQVKGLLRQSAVSLGWHEAPASTVNKSNRIFNVFSMVGFSHITFKSADRTSASALAVASSGGVFSLQKAMIAAT